MWTAEQDAIHANEPDEPHLERPPPSETVINFSDAGGMATVHTHQRRIITKLKNNPAATQLADLTRIVKRKRGDQWYAKYRINGSQVQKRLGPAWTERSRPLGY